MKKETKCFICGSIHSIEDECTFKLTYPVESQPQEKYCKCHFFDVLDGLCTRCGLAINRGYERGFEDKTADAVQLLIEVDEYLSHETYEKGKPVHLNSIGAYSKGHQDIKNAIKSLSHKEAEAVEFAEWIGENGWVKYKVCGFFNAWINDTCEPRKYKLTTELYKLFKDGK